MAFFLIGDVIVKDQSAYEQYRVEATKLIARHGGKYLIRGGHLEVISGDWQPNRLIMLEFPDRASVEGYLNDPEFVRLSDLRQRAIKSNIVMVEGVKNSGRC